MPSNKSSKNVNAFADAMYTHCKDGASQYRKEAAKHRENFKESTYSNKAEIKQYHRKSQKAHDYDVTRSNVEKLRRW